jgi:hypothetical protein
MTELLRSAIEKAKTLPNDRQDEVGSMLLAMIEQDDSQLCLSQNQEAELRRRLAVPLNFVPETEMDAFFRKLAG